MLRSLAWLQGWDTRRTSVGWASMGGWRQNGRKVEHVNQGDLFGFRWLLRMDLPKSPEQESERP